MMGEASGKGRFQARGECRGQMEENFLTHIFLIVNIHDILFSWGTELGSLLAVKSGGFVLAFSIYSIYKNIIR